MNVIITGLQQQSDTIFTASFEVDVSAITRSELHVEFQSDPTKSFNDVMQDAKDAAAAAMSAVAG